MSTRPELHEITADGMAHGGESVGRLPDGRAVFVAGLIPGERARVRLEQSRKNWARGTLVELLEASEDRVEPPCPHFGPCGGCQWQHIRLERQRELKREIVAGQLSHLGKIQDPPVEATRGVGAEDGFGYRNHVRFAVDEEGRTAYHRERSHDLTPVDRCPLLHPLLREWHEALPPLPGLVQLELRAGTRTGQRLAMARGSLDEAVFKEAAARGVPLKAAGEDELTEMVGIHRFRVSSKAFFQSNTDGAELLSALVVEMLDPQEGQLVLDAYAGVGLFAVPLSEKGEKVFAVERHPAAVRDLRHHAKGRAIHVIGTDFEAAGNQLPKRVHRVVADPPREGLGEKAARRIAQMKPERIALVACDPASLARDVRTLVGEGYRLTRVVPVDQFPHTYHVESVAELRR